MNFLVKTVNAEHDKNGKLVIWPEFDGLSKDEYEERSGNPILDKVIRHEWGEIIAKTIELFCQRLDLSVESYMRKNKYSLKFLGIEKKVVWEKELPINFESGVKINPRDSVFFNHAVEYNMSDCVLVFKPETEEFLARETSLSAFPEYISMGAEEAVIYCMLGTDENSFIEILSKIVATKGYQLMIDKKHFVSHWIVANSGKFKKE